MFSNSLQFQDAKFLRKFRKSKLKHTTILGNHKYTGIKYMKLKNFSFKFYKIGTCVTLVNSIYFFNTQVYLL